MKENQALLITEELIDRHVYHKERVDVTWENCSLWKWLNEEFLFTAFNEEERSKIVEVCNQNPDNPHWGTRGGNPTWDRVFALSIEEAERYFKNDVDRRAHVTPYAEKPHDGLLGSCKDDDFKTEDGRSGTGFWWLRSPGYGSDNAASVFTDGDVLAYGFYVVDSSVSVRPAFWLNL